MQSRRFVFTLSNYDVVLGMSHSSDDYEFYLPSLFGALKETKEISFFLFGEEVAPTTGTPHLQGYFETWSKRTIVGLLKLACFSSQRAAKRSLRIAVAKGSLDENVTYCSKEGEVWTFGTPMQQGKRSDWYSVHELAKAGADVQAFTEAVPHLAYPNISKIGMWTAVHRDPSRSYKTRPIIAFGPPRSGKSTWMRRRAAAALDSPKGFDTRVYVKSDADKWWPGYTGEGIICIDEMHGGFFQWQELLRVFEEGRLEVQYKGGSVPFKGHVIYMTCNDHPAFWYKKPVRRWDDSNAFRCRIEEFGELWLFRPRAKREDGSYQFFDPERDIDLLEPANQYLIDQFNQAGPHH